MISMQRSLSSPVCIQSSPPSSPPETQHPSRSPSPPLDSIPDAARAHRFRSRSPTKRPRLAEPVSTLPIRRSEDSSRHGPTTTQPRDGASASKKPIIAQATQASTATGEDQDRPARQQSPPLKGRAASRPPPQPLLPDLSQYTNPHLSIEQDGTTLEELAHLVRLSKYQERKRANTRVRLQRNLISTALSARLTRCGEVTQRNLADCFRKDDKQAFSNLFSAIHDVRSSCEAARRFAVLEPEMESLQSPGAAPTDGQETPVGANDSANSGASVVPFLNDISASAREAFLNFLTQLRTNPDYLATRLCALDNSELQALAVFHQGLDPVENVPHIGRMSERAPSAARKPPGPAYSAVERLLSFQRHDPLSALIFTSFANSAGPDSAEDKRRTQIWATAFARLLSTRSHSEPVLISILNVWSSMRDWSGRSNMEWYLMKILEEGAFLLDRAEDQNGTRFNLSDWTAQDNAAAEAFYTRAVKELFEIIDDEDATGIPEGVIELGNEVLRRLDKSLVDHTRKWFVYKWLFSSWLVSVVMHPESFGMMAEYHITEYGRHKILRQVARKAQDLVLDYLKPQWSHPQPAVAPSPEIKGHIERLVGRFKASRTQRTARLLPARSITSLRETAEVHPFLVVSPADLLTLVNALFPERRPQSAHSGSIRSGAPSISGFSSISQPMSAGTARSNFDTASVLSMSASSVVSDTTTSREPLPDDQRSGTPSRYSPSVHESVSQKRMSNYDDDGYRLRLALHEMVQILGTEVVAGSCHPCAERWTVLFISADGNSLSLQMTYDPDDDPDEENSSTTSDTEDDEVDDKPELDKDYHQLRDSILKLVEDFEIPRCSEDDAGKTTLSNRALGLKRYKSKNKVITPESSINSRNPYRRRNEEKTAEERDGFLPDRDSVQSDDENEPVSALIAMLKAASSQSRVQSDFVSAHLYWKTLQQLNAIASSSLKKNGFASLLNIFSRGPRDSIRRSASAIEEYDAWLIWLKQSQERHEGLIEAMMKRLKGIRDKMWYVSDVRASSPYAHVSSLCTALKIMGSRSKWDTFQRNRAQLSRGPAANYIFQNESQLLDILAVGPERGGPNKLTDDQAEKTINWLNQLGIENFCKGEERIHRFCCEVDICISKLIADNVMDAPVLWSGSLYLRERQSFETPRGGRDRGSIITNDDAASVLSDHDRRQAFASRPKTLAKGLRDMASHNLSQVSLDSSSRFGAPRAGTVISDILDSHDYFGVASPVHAIDSSVTLWSPFQSTMPSTASMASMTSRGQSPTTSVTNLSSAFSHPYQHPSSSRHSATRPGTSASTETIQHHRVAEDKQRFLTDLRRTLTGLLLSDLGSLVFARGSETDAWFSDLGQECINKQDADERRSRRPTSKRSKSVKTATRQRVIEKKRSFGNLRGAGESGHSEPMDRGDNGTQGHDSSSAATSDTISARNPPSSREETPEFPYKKAYQRLLRMFCTHPNPYTKLNSLFELQQLIVASMSASGRRSKWTLRHQLSASDDDRTGFGSKPLEQTIDNVRERRSQTIQPDYMSPRGGGNAETRSIVSTNAANTDGIANILRSLFKDPSMRPQTLFRDLQFIASFVPPSILDKTERGKAFWDAGLAALSLKQDVCRTMVEVADEVVKAQTQPRRPSGGSGNDGSPETPPAASHTLRDAARMLTITAKEGDPTAQRELALFILSNPELVDKTTLPLSKPREVYKAAVMEKFGGSSRSGLGIGGGSGGRGHSLSDRGRAALGAISASSTSAPGDGSGAHHDGKKGGASEGIADVRNDPALMCLAIHWMEAAEQGGDELARRFLGQNDMGLG